VGPPPKGAPPTPGKYGASYTNELNRKLNETTRLGIPVSIIAETTHSGGAPGALWQSVFFCQQPVGLDGTLPVSQRCFGRIACADVGN
jgi:hypothetical protein